MLFDKYMEAYRSFNKVARKLIEAKPELEDWLKKNFYELLDDAWYDKEISNGQL